MKRIQETIGRLAADSLRWAALAIAIGLTGSAWAAAIKPIAVWNGDFVQSAQRGGFTLDTNGNGLDNGVITIKSSSDGGKGGVLFGTSTNYNTKHFSAVVGFENVSYPASGTYSALVTAKSSDSGRKANQAGVSLSDAGKVCGVWDNNVSWDTANNSGTFPSGDGRNYLIYYCKHLTTGGQPQSSGGGTWAYINKDAAANYSRDGLRGSSVNYTGYAIGGWNGGANNQLTGARVAYVALFPGTDAIDGATDSDLRNWSLPTMTAAETLPTEGGDITNGDRSTYGVNLNGGTVNVTADTTIAALFVQANTTLVIPAATAKLIVNGPIYIAGDYTLTVKVTSLPTLTDVSPSAVVFGGASATVYGNVVVDSSEVTVAEGCGLYQENGLVYKMPPIRETDGTWSYTPVATGSDIILKIDGDTEVDLSGLSFATFGTIYVYGTGTLTSKTAISASRIDAPSTAEVVMDNINATSTTGEATYRWSTGYPTLVPAGAKYVYATSSATESARTTIDAMDVKGKLSTEGHFNFTNYKADGSSTLDVLSGSVALNPGNNWFVGTLTIRSGATFVNGKEADAVNYNGSFTANVYGTLSMGNTRWSLGGSNNILNFYQGCTVTGAGQNSNGALDWIENKTGAVNIDGDVTIGACIRLRGGATMQISASHATDCLTLNGTLRGSGTVTCQSGSVIFPNDSSYGKGSNTVADSAYTGTGVKYIPQSYAAATVTTGNTTLYYTDLASAMAASGSTSRITLFKDCAGVNVTLALGQTLDTAGFNVGVVTTSAVNFQVVENDGVYTVARDTVTVTVPNVEGVTLVSATSDGGDVTMDGSTLTVPTLSTLTLTWAPVENYILAVNTTTFDVATTAVEVSGTGLAYPVAAGAKIGSNLYETFQDAIDAASDDAENPSEITLLANVAAETVITLNKTIVFDANSQTFAGKFKGDGVLKVTKSPAANAWSASKFVSEGEDKWTGTFVMGWTVENQTTSTQWIFDNYGTADSSVEVVNAIKHGYFKKPDVGNSADVQPAVFFHEDVTQDNGYTYGYSGGLATKFSNIGMASGKTFTTRGAGGNGNYYTFTELEKFDGTISVRNTDHITIGTVVVPETDRPAADKCLVKVNKADDAALDGLEAVQVKIGGLATNYPMVYATVNELSGLYPAVASITVNNETTYFRTLGEAVSAADKSDVVSIAVLVTPKPDDRVDGWTLSVEGDTYTKNQYTVTWSVDGVENEQTYYYGQTPSHENPTKTDTDEWDYEFTGWDKDFAPVTANVTYTAQFSATKKQYTVTLPEVANATATVTVGNVEQTAPYTFNYGTVVTVTWAPVSSAWKVTSDAQVIELTGNVTAEEPTVAPNEKTFTVVVPANTTVTVTGESVVDNGDGTYTATIGDTVTITYTVTGQFVGETQQQEVEITGDTVSIPTPGNYVAPVPAVAQVGTTYFADFASALAAVPAQGDTVTLLADVSLTERLFVNAGATPAYAGSGNRYATTSENKAITLDLNGFNITSTSNIALAGGSLTITGTGTIATTDAGLAPVEVRGTGSLASKRTLTVGSGVTLAGGAYGLNVFGSNDAQKNVIDVTVNGTVEGTLFVLGNLKNAENEINIVVNGTVVAPNATSGSPNMGIALNGNAAVTVNAGAQVSGDSGIEVRAGSLTVNGGTITGTATTYNFNPNGSGSSSSGVGIAVAQHTTEQNISVSVTSGTVVGIVAFATANPQNNTTGDLDVKLTGGTFTGTGDSAVAVVSDDERITGFVSGGAFSSAVAYEYCHSGYIPSYNSETGKYGVEEGAYQAVVIRGGKVVTGGTIAEMFANVQDGDTVKIVNSLNSGEDVYDYQIAIDSTIVITNSLTIDLNGFYLIAEDCRVFWIKSGDVTITSSSDASSVSVMALDYEEEEPYDVIYPATFSESSSVIRVGDSAANATPAKLTLDGPVTVEADYCYGVTVFGMNDDGEDGADIALVVTNGATVATTGDMPAISGNGTNTLKPTAITIAENSSVEAINAYAIYHPGKGTLTVNGTVVGLGGIEVKAGTVAIGEGAEIEAIAEADKISHTTSNDGTSTTGYAIAAVGNANYSGEPEVVINGGTITGLTIALAEANAPAIGTITATSNGIVIPEGYKWVETATEGVYELKACEYVAQIGTTKFESFAEAMAAAQDGDTVTLLADVSLTERLFVNAGATPAYAGSGNRYATTGENKAITLDLNGFNITSTSNIALAGGSLTITGTGTIETADAGLAPVEVRGTGSLASKRTLTVGSGVTLAGGAYGLNVFGSNDAQKNVIDVTVDGTVEGTLFVLGNLKNAENEINIVVNGTVTVGPADPTASPNMGIALNGNANVTVNDGAVVSGESGIEVRAGSLTVNGGTITATASAYSYKANGSGSTTRGAAISVAQHTTVLPTAVTLNGGTLAGVEKVYVKEVNAGMPDVTVQATAAYTQTAGIPEGYKWVETATEGVYELKACDYVAQVGSTKYESLADAVAAANAATGAVTIELLSDLNFSEEAYAGYKWAGSTYNPLTIANDGVTIDLGGHTISNMGNCALVFGHILAKDGRIANCAIRNGTLLAGTTGGVRNSYVLGIAGVDDMTIENVTTLGGINVYTASTGVVIDGCTVQGTKYYTVCAQCGSQVTIRGTTYTKNTDSTVANKSMFWIQGAGSDSDLVTTGNTTGAFGTSIISIEGGDFTVDTANGGAFYLASGVTPTVSGGTFNIPVPANCCAVGFEPAGEEAPYTVKVKETAAVVTTEVEPGNVVTNAVLELTAEAAEAIIADSGKTLAEALVAEDANGLKKWENYVLDIDTTESEDVKAPAVQAAASDTKEEAKLNLSFTPKSTATTGIKVSYKVDTVTVDNGVATTNRADTATAAPAVKLDDLEAGKTKYVTVRAVLTSSTGTETEIEVQKVVGVMAVNSTQQNTIVAVPWESFNGTSITANELVYTGNRTAGDTLTVYVPSTGKYKTWTLVDGAWGEVQTYSLDANGNKANDSAGDPADQLIPRGAGVWVYRQNVDEKIYLLGQKPEAETATVTVEKGYNLVAPVVTDSSQTTIAVNEVVPVAEEKVDATANDKVLIPVAGKAPYNLYYNADEKAWGYDLITVDGFTVTKTFVKEVSIPTGTGFWYISGANGNKDITIGTESTTQE